MVREGRAILFSFAFVAGLRGRRRRGGSPDLASQNHSHMAGLTIQKGKVSRASSARLAVGKCGFTRHAGLSGVEGYREGSVAPLHIK